MENEQSYLKRRAAQERAAARTAADDSARKAHLELAERYRARIQSDESLASA